MPSWKERVAPGIVAKAEAAIRGLGVTVESVCFDFTNCLVRIDVPDGLSDEDGEAVVAATRAATGRGAYVARPPEYPFTAHLQRPRKPVSTPSLVDGVLEFQLRVSDLVNLFGAYTQLAQRCVTASTVATFALGGLVPLQFMTRLDRSKFANEEDFIHQLSELKAKFHLFPGLLWTDDDSNVQLFTRWLSELDAIEHLVLFDTTFSGGAIGRLSNVVFGWAKLATRPAPVRISVIGIVDEGRLGGAALTNVEEFVTTACGQKLQVTVDFIRASSLVAEDVNELVGYDALRPIGEIEATWSSAIVILDDDHGRTVSVLGTRSLPATFADLLVSGHHGTAPLDKNFATTSEAFGVLMCIRQAASKERDELRRAREENLLTDEEFDAGLKRVSGAESGALKRYSRFFDAL